MIQDQELNGTELNNQETSAESESTQESNEQEQQPELSVEERLSAELAEEKDKFIRLYSEFENFKRRAAKERLELFQTAGKDILISLLPVLDDFDRAQSSMEKATDIAALKEGVSLIKNKFIGILETKGLKAMNAKGVKFDTDLHEAITNIPAPSPEQVDTVIDEVEKGYYLNERVIRFAKVVVGA